MSEAVIPISCLILAIIFGVRLAMYNHKNLVKTRDARVAARREYKKRKNQKLKAWLGIKD